MATRKPTPSIKDHPKQGQLPIHINALYVGDESLNIYLTYDQAVQAATNILKKAELIKGKDQRVIQFWVKKGAHRLYFGLEKAIQKGSKTAWE